ncbi:MAG: DNA polymerase III subunit gamma/tau [Gemmatimonadota bacterium]
MAYQVTARKWRPRRFDEVVGQEHITATLTNALRTGRIAQCYLFCGPRGVGKTTTARILAKALNCAQPQDHQPCDQCPSCRSIADGTSMDVLEIDGASNNSVDDVRELREAVRYIPTQGAHKIYIIDEVHMLSSAAFNALLKTLEEPPARVVFVFATTEAQEVPETILSRCQRFNFRRIPAGEIAGHLTRVAEAEGIAAEPEALFLLARRADGALRDGLSLLDQVASYNPEGVTEATVREVLGLVDRGVYFDLSEAIARGEAARVLDLVATVVDEGGDVEELVRGYLEHAGHLLFAKVQGSAARLEVADAERARFVETAAAFAEEDILRLLRELMDLESEMRRSLQPRFRAEVALVRLSRMGRAVDVGRLLARLEALEAPPAAAARPAPTPGARAAGRQRREGPRSGAPSPPAGLPEPPLPEPPPPDPEEWAPAEGRGPARPSGPAPAAADGPAALSLDQVRAAWEGVLAEVRRTQPTVGLFLQEGQLRSLDGAVLTVTYPIASRFHMTQVMKSREAVEEILGAAVGRPLRLNCQVVEGPASQGPESPPAGPGNGEGRGPAVPRGDGQAIDPTLKSVLDTFDGELI